MEKAKWRTVHEPSRAGWWEPRAAVRCGYGAHRKHPPSAGGGWSQPLSPCQEGSAEPGTGIRWEGQGPLGVGVSQPGEQEPPGWGGLLNAGKPLLIGT